MVAMVKEFGVDIMKAQAARLLREYDIKLPLSDGSIRYALTLRGSDGYTYMKVYDDGALTEWCVDIRRRLRRHRGYSEGSEWTNWESFD